MTVTTTTLPTGPLTVAGRDRVGLGWRPETAGLVAGRPGLDLTEVVAEAVAGHADQLDELDDLVAGGTTVVPHGVGLSLGGADPLDPARVALLARLAQRLRAPVVSEHVAFVRAGGLEAGHLLPVPRTRACLDSLVANVCAAQAELPVPLVLEPIASVFAWPDAELDEPAFLTELVERTGAWLLLDVANLFVNAANHGGDPQVHLDALPLERVAYLHVAGGSRRRDVEHDTHADPVRPEVLDLLAAATARLPSAAVVLERDDDFSGDEALAAELDVVAAAVARGRAAARPIPPRSGPLVVRPDVAPVRAPDSVLGTAQAELVAALVAGGPVPAGFDAGRVATAAGALARKRARATARTWPGLAVGWPGDFEADFADWARTQPRGCEGAQGDGAAFLAARRPTLTALAARVDRVVARARFSARSGRVRRRRVGLSVLVRDGRPVAAAVLGDRTWVHVPRR